MRQSINEPLVFNQVVMENGSQIDLKPNKKEGNHERDSGMRRRESNAQHRYQFIDSRSTFNHCGLIP